MRDSNRFYCSLLPVFRYSRGLIALGACSIALVLNAPSIKANATEVDPVEQIEEEMEGNEDGVIDDDTDTPVDGDTDNLSDSETGQTDEEARIPGESVQTGCTCGETLIEYFETQMTDSQELTQYENLEEFEAAPAQVNRYEYEVLKGLEFMQYTQLILIGLIFILIFKKK